jgi:dipeptidyl aminopeptidase/acylaminoacyl peptidase
MRHRFTAGCALTFVLIVIGLWAVETRAQAVKPADIPIDAFAQLPAMRNMRLSPDGTHLAYIRPSKGRWHLVIQKMIGSEGTPVVVPPVEDLDFEWLHWANNERVVFTVSAMRMRGTAESEETRLWAINRDGSNPLHIVRPATTRKVGSSVLRELPHAQLQGNVIHWLPDELNHILVSLDADESRGDEVRRIDIRNGDFDVIQEDLTGIQGWMADQAGNVRLGGGYINSTFRYMIRDEDGSWISADKASWWDDDYQPLAFSADDNVIYLSEPGEDGVDVVRLLDIRTGDFLPEIYQHTGVDVNRMVVDPLSSFPVGVEYVVDRYEIEYFDEGLASLKRSIDAVLPDKVNIIVSMTADRRKVLIRSSSEIDPGRFLFLDRDAGSLGLVSEAMPGLAPELLSPAEPVSYEARDGLTIPAYLTIPQGMARENLRMIVLPHGGPAARDDQSFWFLTQFLVSRGYAVFQPNFRGSSGYGEAFVRAGVKEWGGKMQDDVTDGAKWLVEQGIANPDKMCIVGWSYGGYSAAMGAIKTPELFRCAASINGVFDLPRLIADSQKYIGGNVWSRHIGLEGERSKAVSPYHQAENIKIPLLIVQAADDARVPNDQGSRMAQRLKRLKKSHEYVEVELGGHNMDNVAARRVILQSLERFIGNNLGND